MTRSFVSKTDKRWVMRCENCGAESDPRPSQADLPLEEFADAGWFIAAAWGDQCPACVARAGGLSAIETEAYVFSEATS